MPVREPFDILILGPMALERDHDVVPEPRTLELKQLVETMVADILIPVESEPGREQSSTSPGAETLRFRVTAPDDRTANVIVPGILDLIEQAELVILDLSRERPNVAYEAALVHALGLPHILITEDRRPPFYFQAAEHIAGFVVRPRYDPQLPSHSGLRRKIADAAAKPGVAADFADNQVTKYFEVPIIDIAGASGLAAGYYANSVRRFFRPGGFFHKPRRIVSPPRAGEPLPERMMRIGHYFAVIPPGGLMASPGNDRQALEEWLFLRDLGLLFATIQRLPDDAEDMRDFGASLLTKGGKLVEPAIVMEIPSTLYALQYAPRMRRLETRGRGGAARKALDVLRQRHFRTMLTSFSNNMFFQIDQDKFKQDPSRFHMIALDELDGELRKIQVLS